MSKNGVETSTTTVSGISVAMMVVLIPMLLAGCAATPPEQALRGSLAELQTALEERDVGGIKERLANDFIGPDGMDREQAVRLAQVSFLRHRNVGVTVGPLDVQLLDQQARVDFSAALTGRAGGLFPDSANVYEVETGWRMENDEWKLTSIDWSPGLQ